MGPHGGLSLQGGTAALPRIGTWNLEEFDKVMTKTFFVF